MDELNTVLVTGGAGYIGSHTVKVLKNSGYQVVVMDRLTTGHKKAVLTEHFYEADICDSKAVQDIVKRHQVDAVIHFAAKSLVGESVAHPDLYFHENTGKTNQFVSALIQCGMRTIVFSSTAAVYGLPETIPISEDTAKLPINPYGVSKLMIEQSFPWLEQAYGLKWMALRYFNAAGASLDGEIGEDHDPETHLIPLVLKTALGQRPSISIYGTDYNTHDGTCIRDYVHVLDLAQAHVLALEALERGVSCQALNVGTGRGYSVREIIEAAQKITGRDIPVVETERRHGDPDILIADSSKIQNLLGWKPQYSDLDTIIRTAWEWHRRHPYGFSDQ